MKRRSASRRIEQLTATNRTRTFTLYWLLGGAAVFAAVVMRKPALIAMGAPFLLAIAGSLATFRPHDVSARANFSTDRITEGDDVELIVEVTSELGAPRVEVEVFGSERLAPEARLRTATSVAPGGVTNLTFPFRATEWGVATVEDVKVRVTDRLGLFAETLYLKNTAELRVGLPHDRRRAALDADRFRSIAGSHTSNDRGEGLELADIRPYQPGDALKNINWRISHRRTEPWVNLRHPDRSTTVVLVVDAHAKVHRSLQQIQRKSVAAALSLVQAHLDVHDRVGLLIVGHTTTWLEPRVGRRQLFRISDALIDVGNTPEASLRLYRTRFASHIPSNAIIIAVSPLLDPLMVRLLAQLRSGGKPVSVLRPKVKVEERRFQKRQRFDAQARELARVEQVIGVQSLRRRGVTIAEWEPGDPIDDALDAIAAMRKTSARAHAW